MRPNALPGFTDAGGAAALVEMLGDTFAVVENPPYVFPHYDIYALAPPRTMLEDGCAAAVMDMDGTTTTTEVLCTGALETMVRRMSGLPDTAPMLNHDRDYPHIIGNSTTKHVEYLMRTYQPGFDAASVCTFFIAAVAWTLECGMDPRRGREAQQALHAQGLKDLFTDPDFAQLRSLAREGNPDAAESARLLGARYLPHLQMNGTSDLVRIGIEIYYQRYHETLLRIKSGQCRERCIEPMPGVGVALALIKGWLGRDSGLFYEMLLEHLRRAGIRPDSTGTAGRDRLEQLGAWFAAQPARAAVVTSSIAAEADIVLSEVFRVIADETDDWPLAAGKREYLHERFSDLAHIYEARVTADDSSEIRLKPHRDLYAIALHALGVQPDRFHRVAGFEDSESGTIAIRAAGVGLCCALPFAMTRDHCFEAATQVCRGGLPEVILVKNFFLPEALFRI